MKMPSGETQVAIEAAGQLLTLMSHISHKLSQRFP